MKTKKKISLILAVILLSIFTACSEAPEKPENTTVTEEPVQQIALDVANIPQYSGSPHCEINDNTPFFSDDELTTEVFEEYSSLDGLGRCGVAYANICPELMPTEERGKIGMIKPSGWHTVKYNDLIDGNYLYNRCHLIAFCLAGENANEKNLITGTRYLNVEGMLPFEEEVARYVDRSGNHVLYRVTPAYEGDNLVASGVLMEAESVEDSGSGICFNVYCYNVQPGIGIDYASGNSWEDGTITPAEYNEPAAENEPAAVNEPPAETAEPQGITYIVNKKTKVFHYQDCYSVRQMKEENKIYSDKTRDELTGEGYKPCGNCNP